MFVLLSQLKPLMERLFEFIVANLFDDVGIPRLVDGECLPAVRALDLVHGYASCTFVKISLIIGGTAPVASSVALR